MLLFDLVGIAECDSLIERDASFGLGIFVVTRASRVSLSAWAIALSPRWEHQRMRDVRSQRMGAGMTVPVGKYFGSITSLSSSHLSSHS